MYRFPKTSALPALVAFLTLLASCASQKDVVLSSKEYNILSEPTSTTLPATAPLPTTVTTTTLLAATTYIQNSTTMTAMSIAPASATLSETDLKALYDKARRARIALDEYDVKFMLADRYTSALSGYDAVFSRYTSTLKHSPYDGVAAYSVGEALKASISALSSLKVEEDAVYAFIFRDKALSAKAYAAELPDIAPEKTRYAAAELWFGEAETQRAGGDYGGAIESYENAAAAYSLSFGKSLATSQRELLSLRGYAAEFPGLVARADLEASTEEALWLQASKSQDAQTLLQAQNELSKANIEYSAIAGYGKNFDAWTARNQAFAEKFYAKAIGANIDGASAYDSSGALLSLADSDYAAVAYEKATAEYRRAEASLLSLSLAALSDKYTANELLSQSELTLKASIKKAAAEGFEQNSKLLEAKKVLDEAKFDFLQARFQDSISKSRLSISAAEDSDAFVGRRIAKMSDFSKRLNSPPKIQPSPNALEIQLSVESVKASQGSVQVGLAAPRLGAPKISIPESSPSSRRKAPSTEAFSPNEPESILMTVGKSSSAAPVETQGIHPAPASAPAPAAPEYTKIAAPQAQVQPAPAQNPSAPAASANPALPAPAPTAVVTEAAANSASKIASSAQKWALSRNAQNNYQAQYDEASSRLAKGLKALASSEYKSALQLLNESTALFRAIPEYAVLPAQYKVRYIGGSPDTFIKISGYSFIYDDPEQWKSLYEANKQLLPIPSNPDLLYPSTILTIPSLHGEKREGLWDPMKTYATLGK